MVRYRREDSVLHVKSYAFALRIVRCVRFLRETKNEFILCKQLLRSGTAIGALVRESEFAQSKADFANKLHIALKEANETDYWLSLLNESDYMDETVYQSVLDDLNELTALLISSIKTIRKNEE